MKKLFFLLSITVALTSCNKDVITGSGNTVTETRIPAPFHGVETHYDISANITYGATQDVKVTGYQNLLSILEAEVVNGVLRIKFPNRYSRVRNNNVVVNITLPALSRIGIYGSGNIVADNFSTATGLFASVNGSGNVWVRNSVFTNVTSSIYGSGDINLETSAFQNANFSIHGSGDINARTTQAKEVIASIYGSGSIFTSVSDKLTATINGSGDINYWGQPLVNSQINGSGRVQKW